MTLTRKFNLRQKSIMRRVDFRLNEELLNDPAKNEKVKIVYKE